MVLYMEMIVRSGYLTVSCGHLCEEIPWSAEITCSACNRHLMLFSALVF